MDEEISAMSKRIVRGIRVEDETVAAALIKEIGPGPAGDRYLCADHTLRWLRSDEYIRPRVSVRGSYALWEKRGKKDTYALARERVKALIREARVGIDTPRKSKLEKILQDTVKK
jgi:trimethylamine--corrinoid protein Co-methyltransferase